MLSGKLMFGRQRRLPISEEMQQWVDSRFLRLEALLGRDRMTSAQVVLANDHFFPDPYRGTETDVHIMARRVAGYMGIATDLFETRIYANGEETWKDLLPAWSGRTSDAAGMYFREPDNGLLQVAVHANQLNNPERLVATWAHELAHVVLLGGGLIDREEQDMEPFTDLTTVFLGMGVLTASAAFQFKQYTSTQTQGWSTRRTGYLSEGLWGYALARFAHSRGEEKPSWGRELPHNICHPFDQSLRWIRRQS